MTATYTTTDKLNRKSYGDFLKRIIQQREQFPHCTDNDSYVIALSAKWGFGKSTFLQMFENDLKEEADSAKTSFEKEKGITNTHEEYVAMLKEKGVFDKNNILPYSAWKGDFWDNAFVPFFDEVINTMLGRYTDNENDKDKAWNSLKSAGKALGHIFKGIGKKQLENISSIVFKYLGKTKAENFLKACNELDFTTANTILDDTVRE